MADCLNTLYVYVNLKYLYDFHFTIGKKRFLQQHIPNNKLELKGGDPQRNSVQLQVANTPSENTKPTNTTSDTKATSMTKHQRQHLNKNTYTIYLFFNFDTFLI